MVSSPSTYMYICMYKIYQSSSHQKQIKTHLLQYLKKNKFFLETIWTIFFVVKSYTSNTIYKNLFLCAFMHIFQYNSLFKKYISHKKVH